MNIPKEITNQFSSELNDTAVYATIVRYCAEICAKRHWEHSQDIDDLGRLKSPHKWDESWACERDILAAFELNKEGIHI